MKFAPDKDFCSTRKDSKSDYGKVTPKGVKWGVKRGQNGVMGVKSYLSSDLHQIWWEGAFLQVIKQSFIRFAFFLLWVPRLTPRRGQMGVKWGSNLIWTLIFTKFGGKEHFCKLLKDLTLDFAIFWLWVPRLTLRRGQMGVKWGPNFIWALIFTKFGGKECFCKLLKALTLDLQFFDFESPIWPPLDPQKGSNGGQIGFKLYLSSDLHHIWWEGAFLLVIKGSFIRFAIFWLWVPIWPPEGVKWGSNGGQKSK